jgi:hypothetical protein
MWIGEDAVGVAEVAEVELDGLDGEEVGGDRVAAEGVEGEDVEFCAGLALEVDAGVAEGDATAPGAVAEVGEEGFGAGGQGDDVGVDLVEADAVGLGGVGGEGAGAEADEAEAQGLAARGAAGGCGSPGRRRCSGRSSWSACGEVGVGELDAVDDATVTQAGAQLAEPPTSWSTRRTPKKPR